MAPVTECRVAWWNGKGGVRSAYLYLMRFVRNDDVLSGGFGRLLSWL